MLIRVLFFGVLKDLAGKSSDVLDIQPGSTVGDVLAHYNARIPSIKRSLSSLALAVNQQYAGLETKLHPNDEVALLPPVSGGIEDRSSEEKKLRSFDLVREPIDTPEILGTLKSGDDGAAVVFEGVVRSQTRGRKTLYLDYEAYEEMALQQMEALVLQARKQFEIRDLALVHRLGRLEIGETSVLIVVVSAHRAAAFDACRWLIDTLKRTVPIWKKEHFEDGAVWGHGEPFPKDIPHTQGSPTVDGASK